MKTFEKSEALTTIRDKFKLTNEALAKKVGLSVRRLEEYLSVATLDKTVRSALHTEDTSVITTIASIPDKSLQMKVAEKTKEKDLGASFSQA